MPFGLSTFASFGGSNVGSGVVDLLLNSGQFDAGLAASEAKLAAATGTMSGTTSKLAGNVQKSSTLMGGSISRFSGIASAGFAGAAAGAALAGKAMIDAASNEEEALNKVIVVFEDSADTVTKFADTSAKSFGISKAAALEAAGGFGSMLQTAGLAVDASAQMSVKLVQLAADLASFNNVDPAEALEKLRSGLAGEAEPLRVMGVFLSEARVQAEAYKSGIADVGTELTEAQKVQARYNLILQDTKKAQGDFARTSDSVANSQRVFAAQVQDTAAAIGKSLLPLVKQIGGEARVALIGVEHLINGLDQLAQKIRDLPSPTGTEGGPLNFLDLVPGQDTTAGLLQFASDMQTAFDQLGDNAKPTREEFDSLAGTIEGLADAVQNGNLSLEEAEAQLTRQALAANFSKEQTKDFVNQLEALSFSSRDARTLLFNMRDAFFGIEHEAPQASRAVRRFAGLSKEALHDFRESARDDLNFGKARFEDLVGSANLGVGQMIRALRSGLRVQNQFANNAETFLGRVQESLGPRMQEAAERLVQSLADSGREGAFEMRELAGASKTEIGQIVRAFSNNETAARKNVDKITSVKDAINNLNGKNAVVDITLRYHQVGDVPDALAEFDAQIQDSIGRQLVRGQTP